jgi:CRP/FNR family cyclic AMP-dependent transcriptional regulator
MLRAMRLRSAGPQRFNLGMISVDKVAFLQNVPLFTGMTPHELIDVAEIAKEITYPENTAVIREGDIGDYLFIVLNGEVMVHRGDVQIRKLGSMDFFGEMSILDRESRSASVTTTSNCLMLQIDQRDFWELLVSHNTLAVAMVKVLTQRLREMLAALRAQPATE